MVIKKTCKSSGKAGKKVATMENTINDMILKTV